MSKPKFKIIKVEGTPEWMISFGDLLSCLLVLFILLLTFSSPKPGKLMDLMGDYDDTGAPGDMEVKPNAGEEDPLFGSSGSSAPIPIKEEDQSVLRISALMVSNVYHEFRDEIKTAGFTDYVTILQVTQGLKIEISTEKLFTTDESTELRKDAIVFLGKVANIINSIGNEVAINDEYTFSTPKTNYTQIEFGKKRLQELKDCIVSKYRVDSQKVSCGFSSTEKKTKQFSFIIKEPLSKKAISVEQYLKKN